MIGVSGARLITPMQTAQLLQCLENIPRSESIVWHIGDANGVDQAARNWARQNDLNVTIHHAISREPGHCSSVASSWLMLWLWSWVISSVGA